MSLPFLFNLDRHIPDRAEQERTDDISPASSSGKEHHKPQSPSPSPAAATTSSSDNKEQFETLSEGIKTLRISVDTDSPNTLSHSHPRPRNTESESTSPTRLPPPVIVSTSPQRRPVTSKSPLPRVPASRGLTMSFAQPEFAGLGHEDAGEYIETIEVNTEERPEASRDLHRRVMFRTGLKGKAATWYHSLSKDIRSDWKQLQKSFEAKYTIDENDFDRKFLVQQEIYTLKQLDQESVVQYLKRVSILNDKCPAELQGELASRTLGGLLDTELQYRVQTHLLAANKISPTTSLLNADVKFSHIKSALIAATRLIGKVSIFDEEPPTEAADEAAAMTTQQIQLETLRMLKMIQTQAAAPPVSLVPPPYSPGPSQPNPFNLKITCYNCAQPGHTSATCQQKRVSPQQYTLNRQRIDAARTSLSAPGSTPPFSSTSNPIPVTAVVQMQRDVTSLPMHLRTPIPDNHYQGQYQVPAETPPTQNWTSHQFNPARGRPVRTQTEARMSGGLPSEASGPKLEEAPVAAVILERSFETMPVNRASPRNKGIARNQGDGAGYVTRMKARASNLPLRDDNNKASTSNPQESAAFEKPSPSSLPVPQVSKVYEKASQSNPLEPMEVVNDESPSAKKVHFQQSASQTFKTAPKNKDSIPIRLVEDTTLSRFDVANFLCGTDITMKFGQLLDRSPQIRAQLARYLQSKVPSRRHGKKQRAAMSVDVEKASPRVLDDGLKVIPQQKCFYVHGGVNGHVLTKCMVDGGAIAELMPSEVADRLELPRHAVEEGWSVKVADSRRVPISEYVMVNVVVGGIRVILRAYILGETGAFDLLLSRNWLHRVQAIENHKEGTLRIQGQNGVAVEIWPADVNTMEYRVLTGARSGYSDQGYESEVDSDKDQVTDSEDADSDSQDSAEIEELLAEAEALDNAEYLVVMSKNTSRQ